IPMAGKAGEPRIPPTLQRSRLKAEEKTLDFEFEVVSAQFNQRGHYALQLTVENPLLQGSGASIQLRINSGDIVQSCTGITDTVEQSDLNEIYSFQRRKFTFTLPRGFCKNDKNHDVRLHVKALHFPGRAERMRRSRQVGEAFFAIYPRTNQPRMRLSAGKDEDWYHYSAVMALLRVGSEQPAMHCGRLAFTASLHEHRTPTTLASSPLLPPSTQEGQQPASPPSDILVHSQTPESAYHSLPADGHTCSPEVREPRFMGQRSPTPIKQEQSGLLRTGFGPRMVSWSYISTSWNRGKKGEVSMDFKGSLKVLTSTSLCAFPLHFFPLLTPPVRVTPLKSRDLLLPRSQGPPGELATHIFKIAVARETYAFSTRHHRQAGGEPCFCSPALPKIDGEGERQGTWKDAGAGRRCDGLAKREGSVKLPPLKTKACSILSPLKSASRKRGEGRCPTTPKKREPAGPARRQSTRFTVSVLPSRADLKDHLVPTALPWAGTRPTRSLIFLLSPKMSRPAGPPEQPMWNTSFLFQGQDAATIFSTDTALAIEYYPYKASESGHSTEDALLSLGLAGGRSWAAVPSALTPRPVRDSPGTLIPVGYSVLPLTSCVFRELAARSNGMRRGARSSALGWQEVSGYRLAMQRMAGDLLSLRQRVTSLEMENGHLRRSLASQEELGHALLADGDLDHKLVAGTAEMRRLKDRVQQLQNELIRKNDREKDLVLLRRAHQQEQVTLRRCQEKVAKMKGLEETVRQQEKVIEVMERVLQEKLSGVGRKAEKRVGGYKWGWGPSKSPSLHCGAPQLHPAGEALSREVYTALLAENHRLREELARHPHNLPPIIPPPPALPAVLGSTEKLSLLARLEEAQARGRALEKQLEETARRWGREKQELGTRLLERDHGF
ncbi:CCD33 protein, partial [Trogon melanurus]|nr:CCD33 protein [Trogon melanurus]